MNYQNIARYKNNAAPLSKEWILHQMSLSTCCHDNRITIAAMIGYHCLKSTSKMQHISLCSIVSKIDIEMLVALGVCVAMATVARWIHAVIVLLQELRHSVVIV